MPGSRHASVMAISVHIPAPNRDMTRARATSSAASSGTRAGPPASLGAVPQTLGETTLASGSKVVMDYYERTGLVHYLDKPGFSLVSFGCSTCIGNSGPLPPAISAAVNENDLSVVQVLRSLP